jgi:SnoaL-like domain
LAQQLGTAALFLPLDGLPPEEQLRTLIAKTLEAFGRIDVLVIPMQELTYEGEQHMKDITPLDAQARVEVLEAFHHFFLDVDTRNWDHLRDTLTDEVTADYTELWGGEVKPQTKDTLVESWQHTLSGFQATQHLLGNEIVTLDGETALLRAYFQARHALPNERGSHLWTVGGRYTARFVHTERGWLLNELTLHFSWADGNLNLFELATQRASSPR